MSQLTIAEQSRLQHYLVIVRVTFAIIAAIMLLHAVDVVRYTAPQWIVAAADHAPGASWHQVVSSISHWGWSLFICAVAVWMLQAIKVSDRIGAGTFKHRPISAIWVWLTPLYNFYRPYELLRDMYQINRPGANPPRGIRLAQLIFIASCIADLTLALQGALIAFNPTQELLNIATSGDAAGFEAATNAYVAAGQYMAVKLYTPVDWLCFIAFGQWLVQSLAAISRR